MVGLLALIKKGAPTTSRSRQFTAFISYRHHKSTVFAENLELAIKAYSRPIWQRPMDVFRDEKYLVPGKPLDELIRAALERSAYLIYLASPEAAASEWVSDELGQWCLELNRRDQLIIVLSEGNIAYDPVTKVVDWSRTDCLPPVLKAAIQKVPLFVDARDFGSPAVQTLENAEFRRAINQIVAKLRNIDPIEMSGREMLQYRRNLRLRNVLFTAIAASSLAFAVAAVVAERNRRDAVAQTNQAEERESELLASASRTDRQRGDYRIALQQALNGLPGSASNPERPLVAETAGALIEAVNANRLAYSVGNEPDWPRVAAISLDGCLVYGTDDGAVVFWRADRNPRQFARLRFQGWITAVSFAADGQKVLITSLDGDVAILRSDGTQLLKSKTDLHIETAMFSPDAARFALGTRDGIVQVRDSTTGEVIRELPRQEDMISAVLFTPDGLRLVAAGYDKRARLWDIATKSKLREFAHAGWITAADIDPSGTILATASLDGTGALWSLVDGQSLAPLAVLKHTDGVEDIHFDAAGARVITASRDRTAKVWSAPNGRLLATLSHTQAVSTAIFMPDSSNVVTGSSEAVRLWRIDNSEQLAVLGRHTERDQVSKIVAAPHGDMVLSTSSGGEVRLWRAQPENPAWILGHSDAVDSVAFSPDGSFLLSSAEDSTCRLWKVATGELLTVIAGGETAQSWCEWYRDRRNILFSVFDPEGTLEVRQLLDDAKLAVFEKQGSPVTSVAYDPQNESIVTAALNYVWMWPRGPAGNKVKLGELPEWVLNLWIDPLHRHAIAASEDGTIAMWDLTPPYARSDVSWPKDRLGRTAVSADGKRLAIFTSSGLVYLYDLDSMKLTSEFRAGHAVFSPIAFSPDGNTIAAAGADGVLWLWRFGDAPLKLLGHTQWISALAFEPQGSRIATASNDGTVRLWDAHSGQPLAVLRSQDAQLRAVDFSPDGRWLASSAADGSIRVWRIERTLAEIQDEARGIVGR
jgi:WD40 repeat protein